MKIPQKYHLWSRMAAAFLCAASATHAMANDDNINFAGFASLAYAKAIGSDEEGPLNGVAQEGEYRDFNVLGLRMDADLHENITFTSQLVAYGAENYNPEFDWILVNVGLTPELRLEIGKTRIPLYMYSDFIDVGYAYQWIEPPSTVYSENLLKTLEGVKLAYTTNMGDWTSELLVFAGADEDHFKSDDGIDDIELQLDNLGGLAWTVDYEWLSMRAVYMHGYLSIDGYTGIDGLADSVALIGTSINQVLPFVNPAFPLVDTTSVEEMIMLDRDKLDYYGFGVSLDFGQVFTVLEVKDSHFGNSLATNDTAGGYLTVGVRLPGKVTLSANYGESHQQANDEIYEAYINKLDNYLNFLSLIPDPDIQNLVAGGNVLGDGLKKAVAVAQDKTVNEYSMQVRWDFHPSAALKFEYIEQDNEQFSVTSTTPVTMIKGEDPHPRAYMIGVDLVF